jgi:hypothetical protein
MDLQQEAYRLALAYKNKPWARRWLRANGKWNADTVPNKAKYDRKKAKEVPVE